MDKVSFKGVYTLNANQYLPPKEGAKRDCLLGFFSGCAVNGKELMEKFTDFDKKVKYGILPKNASCELIFDIKNEKACEAFEKYMSEVGQTFTRIG